MLRSFVNTGSTIPLGKGNWINQDILYAPKSEGGFNFIDAIAGLYAGFFGRGGSIACNPFSRQLYAAPEAAPKFWELLTWKLSWVEDYRQSNTTSEA